MSVVPLSHEKLLNGRETKVPKITFADRERSLISATRSSEESFNRILLEDGGAEEALLLRVRD